MQNLFEVQHHSGDHRHRHRQTGLAESDQQPEHEGEQGGNHGGNAVIPVLLGVEPVAHAQQQHQTQQGCRTDPRGELQAEGAGDFAADGQQGEGPDTGQPPTHACFPFVPAALQTDQQAQRQGDQQLAYWMGDQGQTPGYWLNSDSSLQKKAATRAPKA